MKLLAFIKKNGKTVYIQPDKIVALEKSDTDYLKIFTEGHLFEVAGELGKMTDYLNSQDSTVNSTRLVPLRVKESLAEVAIKIAQALTPEDFNVNEVSSKKAEETVLAEIKMVARAKATEAFSNTAKIDDTITAIMKGEAEKIIRNYIESKPVSFLDGIIENVISQVISNEIRLRKLNESFTKKIVDDKIGALLSKILFPEDPSKNL